MNESPLPRLTVSREEAKEKIQARITEGQRLSNTPYTYEERLRAWEGWSEYNETLLVILFSGNTEYSNYRKFTGFRRGVSHFLLTSTLAE